METRTMITEDIELTMTEGLGLRGIVHLLEVFGSAAGVFSATESELTERAELRADLARTLVRRPYRREAEREEARCRRAGIRPIASTDAAYPALLRECPDYPHVLYTMGNEKALHGLNLSIVGTRRISAYGIRMCDEVVGALAERIPTLTVVSGMAFGVDVHCHRAALHHGATTVGVLPNPLPGVLPAQHTAIARDVVEHGGALVTEFRSDARLYGTQYLLRNRIIAGISRGTLVIESPASGGSLHTARFADAYDRTVMALPGRATDFASAGTNRLILMRKAQLVLSANDIIREMMWDVEFPDRMRPVPAPPPTLTPAEERLLAHLPVGESLGIDALSERCGLDAGELTALLVGLELSGVVCQQPGNLYERC